MNRSKEKKLVLATMDLGAHSARMLIAECSKTTREITVLEDLDVFISLGSDVFRHGRIGNDSIRMLCGIFANFRTKMKEYGVDHCKAIATSAVREAENSEILIERIFHETGIRLTIFEGADEARLNYLTVLNSVPKQYGFTEKSTLIADIGTGACQISAYEAGQLRITETIKVGTLRVLELMPGSLSAAGLRDYLTPIVDRAFGELNHLGSNLQSEYIIAMGASVRTLVRIYGKREKDKLMYSVNKSDFGAIRESLLSKSLEQLCSDYGLDKELAEAVIPCSIFIDNLFRITGATRLLVPMLSMKHGLMEDYMNELFFGHDYFAEKTLDVVRTAAEKYRCSTNYTKRTVLLAEHLFRKLQKLHGLPERDLLLLQIAAWLHRSGLFISNQGSHKHSYYIINSTEIPGISPEDRTIAALTARYHRKSFPKTQHPEFAAIPPNSQSRVLKLSALLRIAGILSQAELTPNLVKARLENGTPVLGVPDVPLVKNFIGSGDMEYFSYVFAVNLVLK